MEWQFIEVKNRIESVDKKIKSLEAQISELEKVKEKLGNDLKEVCLHGQTREIWFGKVKYDHCLFCDHIKKSESQHWSPPRLKELN